MEYSDEFLRKTIKIWQPHSPKPLTLEDAREIADNMAELFIYLDHLSKKYDQKEADV